LIRYIPQSQLTLEGFETPFLQHLDPDNRWVKLAGLITWDKLANIYYRRMSDSQGAPTIDARMVIGAVIIKHVLDIDDREVVEQIKENVYLQYFVGLSSFQTAGPFDASLMVTIRKRLGQQLMEEFNKEVLMQAGILPQNNTTDAAATNDEHKDKDDTGSNATEQEQQQPANLQQVVAEQKPVIAHSGQLMIDATVAEQQIEYPTDLKLLNESRQQLERMIKQVCNEGGLTMPRTYKRKARRRYLVIVKKKNKTKKEIRKGLRQQLQYVKRDLGYIDDLLDKHATLRRALDKRDWKLIRALHETYRQQQEMYNENKHSIADRIVSIYQPHVRPMPRGKDKASVEFGSKQLLMYKDGYTHVHTIGWDNFNEGTCLQQCVEYYREVYHCYPQSVSVDKLFGTQENRKYLNQQGIRFVGKALGRPKKMEAKQKRALEKEMAQRNLIEGKFGQGKTAYGLQKIKARLKDTSESWIMSIYFIMNLLRLAEDSFFAFIKKLFSPFMCRQKTQSDSYRIRIAALVALPLNTDTFTLHNFALKKE
jgi:transposase, IS5 family